MATLLMEEAVSHQEYFASLHTDVFGREAQKERMERFWHPKLFRALVTLQMWAGGLTSWSHGPGKMFTIFNVR